MTPRECSDAGVQAIPDGHPYPEHVAIVFKGFSNKVKRTAAANLINAARERGWQYRPG